MTAQRPKHSLLHSLINLPVQAATEFAHWGRSKPESDTQQPVQDKAPVRPSILPAAERRYLQAVVDHPGQPSSAYPKLAGMSPKGAQVIRRRLVEAGYLREHRVQTAGRGRSSIVLEPLESAHQVLRNTNATGEVKR